MLHLLVHRLAMTRSGLETNIASELEKTSRTITRCIAATTMLVPNNVEAGNIRMELAKLSDKVIVRENLCHLCQLHRPATLGFCNLNHMAVAVDHRGRASPHPKSQYVCVVYVHWCIQIKNLLCNTERMVMPLSLSLSTPWPPS